MEEKVYRDYLVGRGMKADAVDAAVVAVRGFEDVLRSQGKGLESAFLGDIKGYVSGLIEAGLNTEDRLLALARYFWLTKRNDLYAYFAAILGGRGVYASIGERLGWMREGSAVRYSMASRNRPLGSPPECLPNLHEGAARTGSTPASRRRR